MNKSEPTSRTIAISSTERPLPPASYHQSPNVGIPQPFSQTSGRTAPLTAAEIAAEFEPSSPATHAHLIDVLGSQASLTMQHRLLVEDTLLVNQTSIEAVEHTATSAYQSTTEIEENQTEQQDNLAGNDALLDLSEEYGALFEMDI